jgi:hypothetical protein
MVKAAGLLDEIYLLKGLTKGFANEEISYAAENETLVSRRSLIENDKFALLETFRRASLRCQALYTKDDIPIYDKIINDLSQMSLEEAVALWKKRFANDMQLIETLVA